MDFCACAIVQPIDLYSFRLICCMSIKRALDVKRMKSMMKFSLVFAFMSRTMKKVFFRPKILIFLLNHFKRVIVGSEPRSTSVSYEKHIDIVQLHKTKRHSTFNLQKFIVLIEIRNSSADKRTKDLSFHSRAFAVRERFHCWPVMSEFVGRPQFESSNEHRDRNHFLWLWRLVFQLDAVWPFEGSFEQLFSRALEAAGWLDKNLISWTKNLRCSLKTI